MLDHHNSAQYDGGAEHDASRSALERVPLLEAAAVVSVNVEILKESHDEILAIAREYGYEDSEAVRTVLLSGLGYEAGRLHLDAVNRAATEGSDLTTARVDALINDLAAYHSMYSVLKYKAFKLYKQNQRLEFNNSGLRAQEIMWQEWSERMRREREELRTEVLRLRSMLSEFRLDWEASGGPALPQAIIDAATVEVEPASSSATSQDAEPAAQASEAHMETRHEGFWARVFRCFRAR